MIYWFLRLWVVFWGWNVPELATGSPNLLSTFKDPEWWWKRKGSNCPFQHLQIQSADMWRSWNVELFVEERFFSWELEIGVEQGVLKQDTWGIRLISVGQMSLFFFHPSCICGFKNWWPAKQPQFVAYLQLDPSVRIPQDMWAKDG